IRILQNQVLKDEWQQMKEWVKEKSHLIENVAMFRSGGNIKRLSQLAKLKPGKALPFSELKDLVEDLKAHTYEERLKLYDLNPDRADVEVPAGEIFIRIMKWADIEEIFIPKIGLGDGIIMEAYKEWRSL